MFTGQDVVALRAKTGAGILDCKKALTETNGDMEAALRAAKSEYYARLSANYAGSTARVMATVTLEQANGQMILRDSTGAFPVIEPEPEPEVEPESPSEVNGDEEGN